MAHPDADRRRIRLAAFLTASALFALAAPSTAQRSEAEKKADEALNPKSYRLRLASKPELPHGKVAIVEGTSSPNGEKFFVDNLSILQPVTVTLLSRDPNDDIQLQLSKYRYDQADRKGSTQGSGMRTFKIRTQGELKIVVSSTERRPYQLVVWTGDEFERSVKNVLVSNKERASSRGARAAAAGESGRAEAAEASAPASSSPVLWVIAGLLAGIVVLLVVIVFRRRTT